MMEESRKQFERYLIEEHIYSYDELIWEGDRNCYSIYSVHIAWKAWQASRAAIEIDVGEEPESERPDYYTGRDEVINSIRAAGLKIKGE